MNPSERIVKNLCEKSFFSLWSYPNPQYKKKKELCDVLVVFDPYVIIISIKDINFNENRENSVSKKRWIKEAVTKSISQIDGAVKWINSNEKVITNDGAYGINIPSSKRIIRIGIAFGSKGKVPILSGKIGDFLYHIFDELSLDKLMTELDTISDFIEYLIKKEEFIQSCPDIVIEGGEEDLLALYLREGRKFPTDVQKLIVQNHIWEEFENSDVYSKRNEKNKISYAWDSLIEDLCNWYYNGELIMNHNLDEFESAIRIMAGENRFNRRLLSDQFGEMLYNRIKARMTESNSGVTYVFQANAPNEDRDERKAELHLRCILARKEFIKNSTVIGIATEMRNSKNIPVSYDIIKYTLDEWTEEMEEKSKIIKEETNFFAKTEKKEGHFYEYPQT